MAAAIFTYFDSFTADSFDGVHSSAITSSTDVLRIYLTNNTPSAATHTVKADLAEISITNGYGGAADINNAATESNGLIKIDGTGITITAVGGAIPTFQHIPIFNDTATGDPLIGWWTNPAPVDLADGQNFIFNVNAAGLLLLGKQ